MTILQWAKGSHNSNMYQHFILDVTFADCANILIENYALGLSCLGQKTEGTAKIIS